MVWLGAEGAVHDLNLGVSARAADLFPIKSLRLQYLLDLAWWKSEFLILVIEPALLSLIFVFVRAQLFAEIGLPVRTGGGR